MSERGDPSSERKDAARRGLVSSPRGYFGRASRAVMDSLGAARWEPPPPSPAAKHPPVYRAGEPALRLFAGLALPFSPSTPLIGAVATLSGIADGEHEKLLIDLGTSLVRATPERDAAAGVLSLILSRTQSAETYRALLSSIRYVNDAAEPAAGLRKLAVKTVDAAGSARDVAAVTFGVGEMPAEAVVETPAGPATEPSALDKRVVLGETVRFNVEGDYTLFWWPRRLPAGRARRARPSEAMPDAAGSPGSYFSNGGKLYRVFDRHPEAPPAPRAANDRAAIAVGAGEGAAPEPARPVGDVWMPGRGMPLPGFERPRMLRLEDVFGSDMENALTRRLIEQRVAAGA